jgi:hypothetical protein
VHGLAHRNASVQTVASSVGTNLGMAVSAVTNIYACKLTKTSRVYIGNTFPKTVDQVVSSTAGGPHSRPSAPYRERGREDTLAPSTDFRCRDGVTLCLGCVVFRDVV